MSITPNLYAKARSEILALFGWNADGLSPDQTLRVDCAVALRLALDDLQGRIVRGESADVARMLTASEALARLLPAAVLSTPPSEQHDHEAAIAPLLKLYRYMHEQVHTLSAENAQLRARLGLSVSTAVTPREADVCPPGEWRGETYAGVRPGPDDPKPPVTIEGSSRVERHRSGVANQAPAAPPAAPAAKPAWENWVDAELAGAHYSDPWSNRNA